MFNIIVAVSEAEHNIRLDVFLSKINLYGNNLSRIKLQKLIDNKCILLLNTNTFILDKNFKVKLSQHFLVLLNCIQDNLLPSKPLVTYEPDIENNQQIKNNNNEINSLEIIYEDDDFLIVNKPPNLIVHMAANPESNTVVKILLSKLQNIKNDFIRPGIVHRLDKDTSGLLIVAKNEQTLMELSNQMKLRQIKRTYQAIVFGVPAKLNGTISSNIARDPNNRLKMKVSHSNVGKNATTHYLVLKIFPKYNMSLVQCELETGRTHQIRVHMSHIGHSIVGDQTYGKNVIKLANSLEANKITKENIILSNAFDIKKFNRQALHAVKLELIHPASKVKMQFESKLPDDIAKLIEFIS